MKCYNCDADNNAHTALENPSITPQNGDISICFYCGALAEFQDGKLIPLSVEKRQHLVLNEPDVWLDIIDLQKEVLNDIERRKNKQWRIKLKYQPS